MNYKDFTLGDWIGHISGVIEDESELDGNEMRDLVEFLTTLTQEPILDKIRAEIKSMGGDVETLSDVLDVIDKYGAESEE